jgi:hypothetical protein
MQVMGKAFSGVELLFLGVGAELPGKECLVCSKAQKTRLAQQGTLVLMVREL